MEKKYCVEIDKKRGLVLNKFDILIEGNYPNDVAVVKFFVIKPREVYFKNTISVEKIMQIDYLKNTLDKVEPTINIMEPETSTNRIKTIKRTHYTNMLGMQVDKRSQGSEIVIFRKSNSNIWKLEKEGEIHSPIFFVGNTPWKISIRRRFIQKQNFLLVYLVKLKDANIENFSLRVTAVAKITSCDSATRPKTVQFISRIFGKGKKECMRTSVNDSIPWNNFVDDIEVEVDVSYVQIPKNSYAPYLPISIDSNNLLPVDERSYGTETIVLHGNINHITEKESDSSIIYVGNTPWKIGIKKNITYLSIYLKKDDNQDAKKFSFIVHAQVQLLLPSAKIGPIASFKNRVFGYRKNERMLWGWDEFITWGPFRTITMASGKTSVGDFELEVRITLAKALKH